MCPCAHGTQACARGATIPASPWQEPCSTTGPSHIPSVPHKHMLVKERTVDEKAINSATRESRQLATSSQHALRGASQLAAGIQQCAERRKKEYTEQLVGSGCHRLWAQRLQPAWSDGQRLRMPPCTNSALLRRAWAHPHTASNTRQGKRAMPAFAATGAGMPCQSCTAQAHAPPHCLAGCSGEQRGRQGRFAPWAPQAMVLPQQMAPR